MVVAAELWQLVPRGMEHGESSVELRLYRGENDKTEAKLGTLVVRVVVHTEKGRVTR